MSIYSRIPKTNIRQKHLIRIFSYNTSAPIPIIRKAEDLQNSTLLSDLRESKNVNFIGTIQSLDITSSRENNIYRVLDYNSLGKIKEVYPGLPNFTAKATNIALFTQHLLDAFIPQMADAFTGDSNINSAILAGFNIYNQIAPLLIRVDLLSGENSDNTDNVQSIILWDAWFKNSNIEFNVSDSNDLILTQDADITFAYIIPL